MVSDRPNNVEQIRLERMLEQAKIRRTEFLREKPGLAFRIAGGVALVGTLSLLVMFGIRPTRERTLEATVRMEQLTTILSHSKAIAPGTAREITQIIRQPMYDCGQVTCGPVLEQRNRIARLKLEALLQPALLHEIKRSARAQLAPHTRRRR
jgi:hypothetical protein